MISKNTLMENIAGMKENISALRAQERVFIKDQTLAEQVEKAGTDRDKIKAQAEECKADIEKLKTEKNDLLTGTFERLVEKADHLLTIGECSISLDEDTGSFVIGLNRKGKVTPYKGLSGGEKVAFDLALSFALLDCPAEQQVLIAECAELDPHNLSLLCRVIKDSDLEAQVVLCSCHEPEEVPVGWNLIPNVRSTKNHRKHTGPEWLPAAGN